MRKRCWRDLGAVFRTALMLEACVLGATSQAADYALLIGAGKYEKSCGLKDLKYSRDDVIEFAQVLKRSGYSPDNVVLMHDDLTVPHLQPTTSNIDKQLDLLLEHLKPEDTIIVALAGHGVQFQGDKKNYFCPIDTNLDRLETLVSLSDLYRKLDDCQAVHKLLLVDACRNDPQASQSRSLTKMKLESVTRPQGDEIPKSIAAIFSCTEKEQSFEDERLRHGLFFAHVLKAWEGQDDQDPVHGLKVDNKLTLSELANFVTNKTADYARTRLNKSQKPVLRIEGASDWVLRTFRGPAGPGDPRVVDLAEAYRLRLSGDLTAAREAYSRAIIALPADAKARHGRGLVELALANLPAAEADLKEATRLDPTNAQVWISLGGALGRGGRSDEAISAYGQAIKLDTRAAGAFAGRGAARMDSGQLDEAMNDLNQALRLRPDYPDALFNRARLFLRRGDTAAAETDRARLKVFEPGLR